MEVCIDKSSIDYLISFLFGEQGADAVAYSDAPIEQINASVVIRPSSFFGQDSFGKKNSMPVLPLKQWHGMPILYGEPSDSLENGKLLIEADIIASSFFLMSRYEELINPDRDQYGRFPGRSSLPYRAGFLHRPIVEEYAQTVINLAMENGIPLQRLPQNTFSSIYLTHDVDVPWERFSLKQAIKRTAGILKREHKIDFYPMKNWLGYPASDPRYTFEDIIQLDAMVTEATPIYFVKSGGTAHPADSFIYIKTKAADRLIRRLKSSGALIGYHASFDAGQHPEQIQEELACLRAVSETEISLNRNHYLCSIQPADFYTLIENGIKEDYTMAYADIAGFRLGTCRPVRWISPYDGRVTSLILHPLTIMECSLSGSQYMNLKYEEMRKYSYQLVDTVYHFGGELSLLWHNQSLMEGDIHRDLYIWILNYIADKQANNRGECRCKP